MRAIRSLLYSVSIGLLAVSSTRAQSPARPTILIDGHVAVDTALSLAIAKSIQTALVELLRGTGVAVAPLFAPSTDMPGRTMKGDLSEVIAAEKIHGADIAVEINASQAQNGMIFLAPTIVLRRSASVDMAPVSGRTIDPIARAIALRIVKDTMRLRQLATDDLRADTTAKSPRPR